jgi:hypothetical protein
MRKQVIRNPFKYGYGTTSFFLFLALSNVQARAAIRQTRKREMLLTQLDGSVREKQQKDGTSHLSPRMMIPP